MEVVEERVFKQFGLSTHFSGTNMENCHQNKDNNKSDKPNEKNNQQSKLSPQQIKNLLKAMENAEKKVQAKVNDKKQKGIKVVSEKDW